MSYPVMSTDVPWSLVKSGFKKTPHFSTLTQKSPTGRRSAIGQRPYPTWDFSVDLNVVSGGESVQFSVLQKFLGCYMACAGGAAFFLFTDPNDSSVYDQSLMLNVTAGAPAPMGQTGDGSSTQYQLARSIDQGVDILQNVTNAVFYVNGVQATGTLGATGIVTFDSPPPAGAALTWKGTFQYLCQFTEDSLTDLGRVSKNTAGWLWSCSSIEFESVFV